MKMDERLSTVREELEAGSVSPHSLVLLFNTASEADYAGDLTTLEQTSRELAGKSPGLELVSGRTHLSSTSSWSRSSRSALALPRGLNHHLSLIHI